MLFTTYLAITLTVKVITHEQNIGFVIDSKEVSERGQNYTLYKVIHSDNKTLWYSGHELTVITKNKINK